MFYVSQSLTENLSVEAFYQLEWDQTVVDNCGTFFSQPDIIADGCSDNLRVLTGVAAQGNFVNGTLAAAGRPDLRVNQNSEGVLVRRAGDQDARDSGQFGAALRYFAPVLDTEFGAYFMNYHSRTPAFSATGPARDVYNQAEVSFPAAGPTGALRSVVVAGNSSYFLEYPEDIQLYGLSFSRSEEHT